MQNRLPLTIDPVKTAQRRLDYIGIYPKNIAMRLAEAVDSVNSDLNVKLSFFVDNQRLNVISVEGDVKLTLICQRCNHPFDYAVHIKNEFSPVKNDSQAENLPEHYEPIFVDSFGEVDLLAMIEDEMILDLPIAPVHDITHCEVSEDSMVFGEIPEEEEKPNPFAVLASLKK